MAKQVLLIDDSPEIVASMKFFLSDCGCETFAVATNCLARKLLNQRRDWDLVILDGQLLDGDTKKLALELKGFFVGPIVAATGDGKMFQWFKENGFEVFFKTDIKPFWQRIKELLGVYD